MKRNQRVTAFHVSKRELSIFCVSVHYIFSQTTQPLLTHQNIKGMALHRDKMVMVFEILYSNVCRCREIVTSFSTTVGKLPSNKPISPAYIARLFFRFLNSIVSIFNLQRPYIACIYMKITYLVNKQQMIILSLKQ